jgi:predicted nucleotidyltransferase component of viral defense system
MTDPGKSIRARLLNIAKKENLSFQLLIIRYLHERLLFRVSLSLYAGNFCLKGGALMYVYTLEQTRPTMDIDFLGTNIPNEISVIVSAFNEICSIDYQPDAVIFDTRNILAEEITGQDKYPGIRMHIYAKLDTISQRIQVDVCFGDIVIPAPVQLSYPTLLSESGIPVIQAYSLETVVAEKFEAMIDLSTANSRMKDFYDVYQILTTGELNPNHLTNAIHETFRNRNTTYTLNHALFSPAFPNDPNRLRQWKSFLNRNHLDQDLDFRVVIEIIVNSLSPIWEQIR